jgi:hypothetical protein
MPLILGGIWQSIWLFVFAIAGTVKDPTTNPDVGYGTLWSFLLLQTMIFY